MGFVVKEVVVDGVAQRYHVFGQGAAVLVALPGGPGVDWEYLRMPDVERQMTVVYVEPIGTGASGRLPTHPEGYTREVYARFLDAVLDDLGNEKVHLLGHSHGGFVAQFYAARNPSRIAGLVLYDSSPVTGPEQGEESMRRVGEFVARNAGNPEIPDVLAALQSVGSITGDEELTAALRGLFPAYLAHYWERSAEFAPMRAGLRVWYIADTGMIQDRSLLAGVTVPTLVIAGHYDVICGERWAREIHALVPGSRLTILPGSGHMGHLEEPAAFSAAVIDFVADTK
ncbi:alpha/beta hydrolase [Actinoplanes sp. OR16]|uniref:alpha/beta fold hydrolase n=1 Tax=Actinoplanes sp. OR16 TaxID=946334 RepID=UPI000F6D15B3|nr:alpha/beta hydrolase [Actinoplanes sp. OR16]BBH69115.1 alpha/beta hydrolase [Actinoplanes sp. OR16]